MLWLKIRKKLVLSFIVSLSFQAVIARAQQPDSIAPPAQTPPIGSASPDASYPNDGKGPAHGATKADEEKRDLSKGYSERDGKELTGGTRPLENFDTLLVPLDLDFEALPLGKGDFPEYTRELIRGQWRSWDDVDFWVIKPAGVKNPPVILYLYSYPSTLDRYKIPEVCKFLTKNGFAAVGFLPALTGDRFFARPMKQWFISELPESLATTTHDVQFILNYLAKRGDFDMTRVGMFGDGSGASIAVLAASVDPRIKTLDLLDPWGDWPDWLAKSPLVPDNERADYLKPDFLKKVEHLDPLKVLPELKTQRVRLQHIQDLKVTPPLVRERLEAVVPPNTKIVHYDSTKVFLMDVASPGKSLDWIKEQLGSISATNSEPEKKANATAERSK